MILIVKTIPKNIVSLLKYVRKHKPDMVIFTATPKSIIAQLYCWLIKLVSISKNLFLVSKLESPYLIRCALCRFENVTIFNENWGT